MQEGTIQEGQPSPLRRLLRDLGSPESALIEQAPDGTLLLGPEGERLAEHYSFYAVFQSAEEYRVVAAGRQIGTLPATNVFVPEMTIVLSGRRWRITQVHSKDRVIEVSRDRVGRPPTFGGGGGQVHDRIIEKMKEVFSDSQVPRYLDKAAAGLLQDARSEFRRLRLETRSVCSLGERNFLVATWAGTVKTFTLALLLKTMGYRVTAHDGFLEIEQGSAQIPVESALQNLASAPTDSSQISLPGIEQCMSEKYHRYLGPDLLYEDAVTSVVDLAAMPMLIERILAADSGS